MASVLVVGLFIITFNLQAFEIPSSSMENTLLIGDHVFVDRIRFAPPTRAIAGLEPYRAIKRDDIIVFLHPDPRQAGTYVVKRVIGTPGDHIRLKDGVVYRNGEKLDRPYVRHCAGENPPCPGGAAYDDYRDNFPSVPPSYASGVIPEWRLELPNYIHDGELVVPPGRYFGMGDNRDVSYDSRFWGFIPQENIIGRPLFIYWSFETPDDQWQKNSMGDRLAFLGRIVIHFFDETRWRRTLHLVQ
ncbi:MAG: signal peptidase I [Acidobacteria bacterium]|nr:signal peptidase I [Acidobacteriota bacterium]